MKLNLVLLKKDGTTRTFHLPSTITVIGRREDCDLCVPLPLISRRHCELALNEDNLTIRDLNSRNGTFINGRRMEDIATLRAGDEIQLGPVRFMVQIDGQPLLPSESQLETPTQEKQSANSRRIEEISNPSHNISQTQTVETDIADITGDNNS